MQDNLKNILTNLSPEEFSELVHSTSMAYNTRNKMRDNEITIEALSKKTKLPYEVIFNFLCGAHEYGFMHITKIDYGIREIIDDKKGNTTLDDIFRKEDAEKEKELIRKA